MINGLTVVDGFIHSLVNWWSIDECPLHTCFYQILSRNNLRLLLNLRPALKNWGSIQVLDKELTISMFRKLSLHCINIFILDNTAIPPISLMIENVNSLYMSMNYSDLLSAIHHAQRLLFYKSLHLGFIG